MTIEYAQRMNNGSRVQSGNFQTRKEKQIGKFWNGNVHLFLKKCPTFLISFFLKTFFKIFISVYSIIIFLINKISNKF